MNKHSVCWDFAAGGRGAGGAGGLSHSETLQWQRPFVLLPWMLPQRSFIQFHGAESTGFFLLNEGCLPRARLSESFAESL